MGGMVGAVDRKGKRTFCPRCLRGMSDAIAHRGPDGEHAHEEPGLAMGTRRLATGEKDGESQPLANENTSIWAAFNGEIHNASELREELLARRHRMMTRSDSELWCHLYEDLGEGMFERIRGPFAVALWDADRRTLLLGRDRLGACPLFYAEADGWILWASEIKGLLASGWVAIEPDPKGIDHAFTFYASGAARTAFKGIHSIPPGHYLRVSPEKKELICYWDLDYPDAGDELRGDSVAELEDELERVLRQAIRRRIRGMVPVAGCLSGGLDSSVIMAMAREEGGDPLEAFTIGMDRAGPDERSKAEVAARAIGSPLHTLETTPLDIAEAYPDLIRAVEFPDPVTSDACMMRLTALIRRQGFGAALTGEGADESMAGHHLFKAQKFHSLFHWELGRIGYWLTGGGLRIPGPNGASRRTPFRALAGVRTARQLTFEVAGMGRELFYSDRTWASLENHSPFDDLWLPNERLHRWHPMNQAAYIEYHTFLPGLILCGGDRVGMRSAVILRRPFLDEDLIAFTAKLHPRYKLRGWTEKWLLRRVAERVLPKRLAWLRKQGLQTNLSSTFLGPHAPPWIAQLLSPESLRASGYFDPQAVARCLGQQSRTSVRPVLRLATDAGLTAVIATQLWHHAFMGGGLADLPSWSPPPRSNSEPGENTASETELHAKRE